MTFSWISFTARGGRALAAAALLAAGPLAHAAAAPGTHLRPFAANSLWNSVPVSPVLGDFQIPKSLYYPLVGEGAWSSGVFQAKPTDAPATIVGAVGAPGIWDPDSESYRASIVVPRWPAGVIPAAAADGHADIVDETAGIVHSFYQLRRDGSTWRAAQYAWTRLAGRGWGEPGHYFQGARAAAVPTSAGLIRKHEVNDGDTQFRHALAMSLTHNGLAASPAFVFPATSADGNAATTNTGKVPEGTLLLLPAGFDVNKLATPLLRKVAQTLKTYGGYVVDRNTGTPFVIYAENGAGVNLHAGGWNTTAANELDAIRAALRPMVSAASWKGADGSSFVPSKNLNLLSMRGAYTRLSGNATATFDTWQQAASIPAATQASEFANYSNRNVSPPAWAALTVGTTYRLTARTTGGARIRLQVHDKASGKLLWNSGYLANGASADVKWPTTSFVTIVYVSTLANQAATASAVLARP